MPNLARSPPLNKSYSLSESDIVKTMTNPSTLDDSFVTFRESKRRRVSENEKGNNQPDFRTIIREELQNILGDMQAQQNLRLDSLEKKMSNITTQNAETLKTNIEIEKSIGYVSEKLDELQSTICKLEEDKGKLWNQISKIDEKCEAMERNLRKTCVQIRNVPKQQGEIKANLYDMVCKLSLLMGVSMEKSELRDVFRVPTKPNQVTSTVVVEFSSTLFKENFLSASKKHISSTIKYKTEQLNSTQLGLHGAKTAIYISEHLTQSSSRLYFLARDFKKTMGYDFCWTSNGLIFLRKKHGDPHILIKTEGQLQELRNK